MTKQKEPMVGRTFGRLTVISEAGRSKNGSITYLCSCSCGNQVIVKGTALRSGNNLSCGCLKKEVLSKKVVKNLAGTIINGIKVIREAGRTKAQKVKWLCICPECGKEFVTLGNSLLTSRVKRCPTCSTENRRNRSVKFAKERVNKQVQELVGRKYGELTIVSRSKNVNEKGRPLWVCHCNVCNKNSEFTIEQLRGRKTCGCVKPNTKHGLRFHRLYSIWSAMKSRCYNPNTPAYKNYGERGISICDEWHYNFQSFFDWAVTHGYESNLTIERLEVNGNYEPNNCTWIPIGEQANNTRRNHRFTYKGGTLNVAQWANKYNVGRHVIEEGIEIGDLETSVNRVRKKRNLRKDLFLFNGEEQTLKEICKKCDVSFRLASDRLYKLGWSLEKALNTPPRKITKDKNKNI